MVVTELVQFLRARHLDLEQYARDLRTGSPELADWILRTLEAERQIMVRHSPGDPRVLPWIDTAWCDGCGIEGEADARTEDIDNCPELRSLAWPHVDHQDYPRAAIKKGA